jgi:hypothetical protein
LSSNTSGSDNTAVGSDACRANTTGNSNTIGQSNTALGFQALFTKQETHIQRLEALLPH